MIGAVVVVFDTAELQADVRRVIDGELALPTVSAVKAQIDGKALEDIPVYLTEDDFV